MTLVQLLIAISTIVGGLYVLSPFLELSTLLNGASGLIQTLGSPIPILVFGVIFLATGLALLYGIWTRKAKVQATALFINILLRTYAILGGWLAQGFLPLTWLTPVTLVGIAIVCYFYVRGQIARGLGGY